MSGKGIVSIFRSIVALLMVVVLALAAMPQPQASNTIGAIDFDTTIKGMNAALKGAPGTWMYMKDSSDLVVLGWQQGGNNYGFSVINRAGDIVQDLKSMCNGNCMNWLDSAQFLKWLESEGWRSVPAGMAPVGVVSVISQAAFLLSIGRAALSDTLILVLPASIDLSDPEQYLHPEVQG